MAKPPLTAGPAPTAATLREAALAHLARFGTTRAGLLRVLQRRIERWARLAGPDADTAPSRAAAAAVVAKLAELGAVDDAAYAASRARSLGRAGRSRRATLAHLRTKGVAAETATAATPDDPDAERAAALAFARRRRFGPFRTSEPDEKTTHRELGAMARAGFSQEVARAALATHPDEAEALVIALKQS